MLCGTFIVNIVSLYVLFHIGLLPLLILLEIQKSLLLRELLLIVLLEMLVIKIILMFVLKSLEFEREFEISGKFWFFAIFVRNIGGERERDWCFNRCNSSASCNDKNRYRSTVEIIGSFLLLYWMLTSCLVLLFGTVITWNNTVVIELCLSYVTLSDLIFWVIVAKFISIFRLVASRIGHKCGLIIISGILLSVTHIKIFLPFQIDPAIMILLLLSLEFNLFPASVFPGIVIVIHKRDLGVGFNIITNTLVIVMVVRTMRLAIMAATQNNGNI